MEYHSKKKNNLLYMKPKKRPTRYSIRYNITDQQYSVNWEHGTLYELFET